MGDIHRAVEECFHIHLLKWKSLNLQQVHSEWICHWSRRNLASNFLKWKYLHIHRLFFFNERRWVDVIYRFSFIQAAESTVVLLANLLSIFQLGIPSLLFPPFYLRQLSLPISFLQTWPVLVVEAGSDGISSFPCSAIAGVGTTTEGSCFLHVTNQTGSPFLWRFLFSFLFSYLI